MIPQIIDSYDLIICVAAGLMHIAMSLKKEMIILLGPTPMERWVRKMYYTDCIRAGLDCQPCEGKIAHGGCFRKNYDCMKKIQVEEVFKKACEKITALEKVENNMN
jgi:ADP-heptose:LPS heptosyltransferase